MVKCLVCKHKDVSSGPRYTCKKTEHMPISLATRTHREEKLPACCPDCVVEPVISKLIERPWEKYRASTFDLCMHTHVHMHTLRTYS